MDTPSFPSDAHHLAPESDHSEALAAWTARWVATRDTLALQVTALDTAALGTRLAEELPALIAVYGGDAHEAREALDTVRQLPEDEARRDALLRYWAHAVRIGADDPAPLLAPLDPPA